VILSYWSDGTSFTSRISYSFFICDARGQRFLQLLVVIHWSCSFFISDSWGQWFFQLLVVIHLSCSFFISYAWGQRFLQLLVVIHWYLQVWSPWLSLGGVWLVVGAHHRHYHLVAAGGGLVLGVTLSFGWSLCGIA
jgi:hypothetical protein